MVPLSIDRKGHTRERILESAARLLLDRGTEGTSVEAVMRGAGLTVGGFYAHFASKEALVQEALPRALDAFMESLFAALEPFADDRAWVTALVRRYLRQADDPNLGAACPLTLALPDVARGMPALHAAFAERTAALLDRVAHRFPPAAGLPPREVAIAVFAGCAGAVALARTIPAHGARERVLRAAETALLAFLASARAPG
jgi:TetR/AcrR family transcriptional repressor of nem operon